MKIDVFDLSLSIGNKTILHDVSLSVACGEVVGIIGPNGAGKSSLLKLIAGDISADSGRILFNNMPLDKMSNRLQALHRAVVAQHVDLSFPMLVDEIVALGWLPECGGKKAMQSVIRTALKSMDISHLAQQNYATLSGGEKQRVQISRAIIQLQHQEVSHRYLLLDEPTSSLDLYHQIRLMRLLQILAQQGIGVLVVLHDLNLAANFTHKLVVLKQGEVVMFDQSHEVLRSNCLSDVYQVDLVVRSEGNRTTVFVN